MTKLEYIEYKYSLNKESDKKTLRKIKDDLIEWLLLPLNKDD